MSVLAIHQNKVDVSEMSEQDQKAFKMYGKVPGKNLLTKMQKDRKYFDSGDYMMSKAGVTAHAPTGTAIPTPEGVPHASPPVPHASPPGNSPSGLPFGASPTTGNGPMPPAFNDGQGGLPSPALGQQGGVGVGISPGATSEAVEVPGNKGHTRRGSESNHGVRISPPGQLREGNNNPSSSFPIGHGGFGSSPVKTSNLARRLDEEIKG